jgi:carbon starvation protein
MNAAWLILGALGVFAVAYRYYSAFLAARVLALDDARETPAHRRYDGQNYHPTHPWVLWGHHFAAIAGAGPLIGPILAAQFGYLPGFLWLVFGVCLGGAVQDLIILAASVRHDGRSLAEIARVQISRVAAAVTMVATLLLLISVLAAAGLIVVKALAGSPWGTFTIAMSVPIALVMGLLLYRLRRGRVGEVSAFGVAALVLCLVLGAGIPSSPLATLFDLSETQVTLALAGYGFIASALPVWLLLCPRDYLSAYLKIGTLVLIVAAILVVRPELQAPALNPLFLDQAGPLVPGALFPFVFITIACGAISGFHALVASGTTPKMIDRETHVRPIGYGAMLMESLVGITALIAGCAMGQTEYFQINLKPEQFAAWAEKLHLEASHLSELALLVGEPRLEGRTGGGVSLAVSIAEITGRLPGMRTLMSYLYHFVILFEALFVLTLLDTGTRIARFVLQELLGRLWRPMAKTEWAPGTILASFLAVAAWSSLIFTGTIQTLWPMVGIANQLLATAALTIGTSVILNSGRARYAWVTLLPLTFVAITTMTAGYLSIRDLFLPMITADPPVRNTLTGALNSSLTAVMMLCVLLLLCDTVPRWLRRQPSTINHQPSAVSEAAFTDGPSTRAQRGWRYLSRR